MRRLLLLVGAVALVVSAVVAVGVSGTVSPGAARVCWVVTDLGKGSAAAINERGQVIGSRTVTAGQSHAFLWEKGKLTDLGTLGGSNSTVVAVNDHGRIVGWSETRAKDKNGDPILHAFLWQDGKMADLGTLGGQWSKATDINEDGQVVGAARTRSGAIHAFVWKTGKTTDLGTLPGTGYSWAAAINERGQIIGHSENGKYRGFLWEKGRMIDIGSLRGRRVVDPVAINEQGQIVGSSSLDSENFADSRAFLWQKGRRTNLGILGGKNPDAITSQEYIETHAVAINNKGQIVGSNYVESSVTVATDAVLWQNGRIADLGRLKGGNDAAASAINERGQIVGSSSMASGATHAVLWQDGAITDLGTLPGGRNSNAVAINEHNQIIGTSTTSTGATHAGLWTAQPAADGKCPAPAPKQPPAKAQKNTLIMGGPIIELKADAGRAIVLVEPTGLDPSLGEHCADILVWNRAAAKIITVFDHRKCGGGYRQSFFGVALAGDTAAWVQSDVGNDFYTYLSAFSLLAGRSRQIDWANAGGQGYSGDFVANPHGDGALLVYNDYDRCQPDEYADVPCPAGYSAGDITRDEIVLTSPQQRVIARAEQSLTVLAVGGGRVVARLHSVGLIVLAPRRAPTGLVAHKGYEAERLIATYPYKPDVVRAAATDGHTLAVLREGALDVIPLPGTPGTRTTRKLAHAASYGADCPADWLEGAATRCSLAQLALTDLDGHIVVYTRGNAVYLLDLTTGRSVIAARPNALVSAQLEPDGLYIASRNTLTFTPRSQVEQRLHR